MFSKHKKLIPWIVILAAVILTLPLGLGLYENHQEKTQVEQAISHLETASRQQSQAMRAPAPLRKPRDSGSDLHERSAAPPKAVADPYTLEIEAQGVKLKMINEATWGMIFKICFLWAFVLASLAIYRRYTR